jgi:hypothetical protein
MSSEKTKNDRKKVSLNEATYKTLNIFSRLNGLKLRMVVDSMVDVILNDEQLSKRVADLAVEKQSNEKK